jgi:AbrB family looped-hinge helix DNA binding protein
VSKVTSKLQVTVPKAIATQYRIKPGDEVLWVAAGDAVRLVPKYSPRKESTPARRLALFDLATARQRERQRDWPAGSGGKRKQRDRGWTREELYDRGRAR